MNLPISTNQDLTMSSFDFHSKINELRESEGETRVRHNDFLVRITDEIDDLGAYETFVHPQNKQPVRFYNLNQDQMILVGMRESKIVRRKVLDWIKTLSKKEPKLPQSFAEALQLAADQAKQLELAAPKVEFHDTVVQSEHTYKFQEAGKKIQQRPNKFVKWLRDNGYLMKNNIPYQQYIDLGVMIIHTGINGEGFEFTQGRITTKGLSYFTKKLNGKTL